MSSIHNKQIGLSLIELMIAITLGLILMAGVTQIFVSSKVVFSTQQGLSRIQETGRLAIDFMSRDISAAGYYGCYKPVSTPVPAPAPAPSPNMLNGTPLSLGGLHGNFEIGIRGYDSTTELPGGAAANAVNLGTAAAIPDNSILVIHSANQDGFILNGTMDYANLIANVPASAVVPPPISCVGNICEGAAAVVSDCNQARVFQIAANGLALAGTTLTVNHSLWAPASPMVNGVDGATFLADAELRPMNTIVYFLATGTNVANTSLWQRTNLNPPVELLEGVERMSITYSTTANAMYRTAAMLGANEWALVNAVRIELVVRSLDNNVLEKSQPYVYQGTTQNVVEPDRFLRQVFITTVAKRN